MLFDECDGIIAKMNNIKFKDVFIEPQNKIVVR